MIFNYIITIHNKEKLIGDVLEGVLMNCRENSYVYPVLDGCDDGSERIVDAVSKKYSNIHIRKIITPNVHEILSINAALSIADQTRDGFNISVQDDVVIEEKDLQGIVKKVYDKIGYANIGVLAFRHGADLSLIREREEVAETNLIESVYGAGIGASKPLLPGYAVKRMTAMRSPDCISTKVIREVGLLDEKFAPFLYDSHDYSIRCLKNGYSNYVFGLNFKSELEWGGFRTNPQPGFSEIALRNNKRIFLKHSEFIEVLNAEKKNSAETPFFVVGNISDMSGNRMLVDAYMNRRKALNHVSAVARMKSIVKGAAKKIFGLKKKLSALLYNKNK